MTLTRILTAAILIPIVVSAVLYAPTWLIALIVGFVILMALVEFFDLAAQAGVPGFPGLSILCAALLIGAVALWEWDQYPVIIFTSIGIPIFRIPEAVLVLFILGIAILVFRGEAAPAQGLAAMGTSSAALLFIALPMAFLIFLHAISEQGSRLVLFLLCVIWAGDTVAYFVGRSVGRHPMAPRLSPHKTWEGAAGNLAGSLLAGAIFVRWISYDVTQLLTAAALGNIAGQMGDLMESVYKRAAGAKDSGSLLPGHGGILDRIDSLIFAAPVVWYYFSVIVQRPY